MGEWRDQIGEDGVIAVVRHADDRHAAFLTEQLAQPGGRPESFLEFILIESRIGILSQEVPAGGKFLQHGADALAHKQGIVEGAEPREDALRSDAHPFNHSGQRRQRSVRPMAGMFPAREPFFLIVADDAGFPVRCDLHQSGAAVVAPAHADAGEISGFATSKQGPELPPPFGGERTGGAINLLVPEKTLGERKRKGRSKRS